MTYQEISNVVESIGLPCAYYEFQENTVKAPPFLCWLFTDSDDMYADNTNYSRIRPLAVELYTDIKDFVLETRVENALNAAGLSYTRSEAYIDSERMFQITYTMEVTING